MGTMCVLSCDMIQSDPITIRLMISRVSSSARMLVFCAGAVVMCRKKMIVHLIFFLHITTAPAQKTNIMALLLTLLIISLIVIGSLWIMSQLSTHMVPMGQLMHMQR